MKVGKIIRKRNAANGTVEEDDSIIDINLKSILSVLLGTGVIASFLSYMVNFFAFDLPVNKSYLRNFKSQRTFDYLLYICEIEDEENRIKSLNLLHSYGLLKLNKNNVKIDKEDLPYWTDEYNSIIDLDKYIIKTKSNGDSFDNSSTKRDPKTPSKPQPIDGG